MTFVPRSHVPLQDAIDEIGRLKFDEWSGKEISPIIWKTGSYFGEKEVWIAEAIAEAALNEWGVGWVQAAGRFYQQYDIELESIRRRTQIDALKAELGDEIQAWARIALQVAALYIYRQAKHRFRPIEPVLTGFGYPETKIQPPYLEAKEGPEPLEIDEATLASFEKSADEEFAAIEKLRLAAQTRFIAVTEWFRQELFGGPLACAYLAEDGQLIEVPKETWATDRAFDLFKTCQFEEHQLLVPATFLERHKAHADTRNDHRDVAPRMSGPDASRDDLEPARDLVEQRKPRERSATQDDVYRRNLKWVERKLKNIWPAQTERPPVSQMARDLSEEDNCPFSADTLRQIIVGRYGPAIKLKERDEDFTYPFE